MTWDDVVELFNPGHKHLAEERDRKRIEAQLPGSQADDDLTTPGIDLDAGTIYLPATEPDDSGNGP